MKTNAIIRIIVWSLVIVLLIGLLGSVLLGRNILRSLTRLEEEPVITEPLVAPVQPLESEETIRIPAEDVRDIEIEWAAGKILIQPIDTDEVQFSESDITDIKNALVWKQRGTKLSISFCEESAGNFINFGNNSNLTKDLTIYVPNNWQLNSLEIDAASASLEVNDLRIQEVEIDTASGTCDFDNCMVDQIDLDTASGDVRFYGYLDILDCDAASASIYAVLSNIPTRMDLDSMSGDLDITLPADAGFTASVEGLSADFSSDFETTNRNGSYIYGDGRCRISVDAMSGDVIIRKGAETPLETVVPTETITAHHEHTEQCTTDPNTCPDNVHHEHTEQCTTDPSSCPDNVHHEHTEQCTTNPSSCPDNAHHE